jgi:hypothetical protein
VSAKCVMKLTGVPADLRSKLVKKSATAIVRTIDLRLPAKGSGCLNPRASVSYSSCYRSVPAALFSELLLSKDGDGTTMGGRLSGIG